MHIQLPQAVSFILDTLHQHGHEAYIIGGCVRNALLNLPIHDYDITTSATPQIVMEIFESKHIPIFATGLKHGTVTLRIQHESYEITTYRSDIDYINHRTPSKVDFAKSLQIDVLRRDFTINTLAYNEEEGMLDFVGGLHDLDQKIIRCVGEPQLRFEEDALRLLRAVRFMMILDFQIDTKTLQAIRTCAPLLSYISKERIRDEWNKMLLSNYNQILSVLYDSQLLPQFLIEVAHLHDYQQHSLWHPYDMFKHTQIALQNTVGYTLREKLAVTLHDIGKPSTMIFDEAKHGHFPRHALESKQMAYQILKRLKYDTQTIKEVCTMIEYHDYFLQPTTRCIRRFLGKLDGDYDMAIAIMHVQLADDRAKDQRLAKEKIVILYQCLDILSDMRKNNPAFTLKSLVINGNDLKDLGYEGKQIGTILHKVLQQVIEQPSLNHKDIIINYIKKTFPLK